LYEWKLKFTVFIWLNTFFFFLIKIIAFLFEADYTRSAVRSYKRLTVRYLEQSGGEEGTGIDFPLMLWTIKNEVYFSA